MERSKTLSKKLISLVLSLLMVLSCFSGLSLTAFAAPTCPNPSCGSTNVEPFDDTWECQDCGYIFNWVSGDDDPAEDGQLVGTVIKVGDTLTLDGDYIESTPGNSDEPKTNSYKLERMEYDDPRGWWFVFEEGGAFMVAGDETPEPDGFYVSGGNGTQSHPYTLALHYASAAPVTEWHIGDPINLGGKYYINDDQGAPSSYGFDRDVIVSEPVYETMYNQWIFENVIASNASEAYALYISLPTGKTASDVPTGFKVKSGDGTEASPYEFELVYAAAATAYAGLKNTTTVVHFDSKDWYLIEDNSTAVDAGTVTLLAKECVGASIFGGSSTYSGSTVEGVVNNYYTNSISTDAKAAVDGSGMFLLTTDQANAIKTANVDVLKCSKATGAESILWWLGSPCDPYNAACVYGDDGSIRDSGEIVERTLGVRPALKLDLSKVEFDSETKTFAVPAAVTEYPLWVGGVLVTSENMSGEGWNYAADTNTLTLNGATITGYGKDNFKRASIYYEGEAPFIIDVEGVNVVGKDDDDMLYSGIVSTSDKAPLLTIQGNGSLEVKGYENGIKNEQGNIVLAGGTINATGGSAGITGGYNNAVTISGGDITATSSRSGAGILLYGDDSAVTITNGTVKASSVSQYGYNAGIKAGTVSISGGTVEANAISNYEYKQEIYGIQAYDVITITGGEVTASGEIQAICGTVKNDIAGLGWTDVAGTTGQAAIATSTTGQSLSDYKKVYFTPHTHNFSYSVSGATITATCTADDCTLTDSRATLTIVAPTLTVYGGTGSAAATLDGLDAFNAATGLNVDAHSIVYWKAKIIEGVYKTDGNEPLAGAPTNAGNYLAKITVSNCIASVGYTIAKADPIANAPTGLTATFGQTLADVTITNPSGNTAGTWAWLNDTASVGNVVTPAATFKANFIPTDTANYNTVLNVDVTVTVGKANPTYTVPTGLEATYGDTLSSVTLPTGWSWVNGSQKVGNAETKTFKATYTPADTTNYNVVNNIDVTVTVNKADINPTVSITGWTYGQAANSPSVSGNTGDGHVKYTYAVKGSDEFSETVPTDANTYTVKATIAATTNYNGKTVTADFTIAKATPNLIAPKPSATYGDTLADATMTNHEQNVPGTWAWVDDTQSVGNAGENTFKATFTPDDTTNYNVVNNIDVTVTVNKADINPTVTLAGWTYGETANTPSVSGNTGNGTVTYTYAVKGSDEFSETVPTAVNDYTVKASIAATDNYKAGTATADFMVAKADIAPTVSIEGWTYGDEANKPSIDGNTGKGVVTYLYKEKGASDMSCIEEAPTQAGEYTVKAIIGETDNYNAGSATADFTIAKAKVTITANDKSSKREAALKELTCTLEGEIFEGDDLGVLVTTNAKAAVAGKYAIEVSYTENTNYDVTIVNGTYTVIDRITTTEKTNGKNKINSAIKATVNKNGSITAKWGAVANAQRFEIYAAYCDGGDYKKIKTVNGDVTSFDITKLGGKALNQKKSVKLYVVAYRKVNGNYEKIAQSVTMHVAGAKNTKQTNAKAITVKQDSFTLNVKKTATIKPTLVLQNSKKKAVEHVAKFRYQSTNTAVVTVDANGKITAVGKGTCTIYIFANNGKLKSVKVTVK